VSTSWRKSSPNYAESAINAVRLVVAADRDCGMKTHASIEMRAPHLGLLVRRSRRLFERDRVPHVGLDEWRGVLAGTIRVLRLIADKLREKADRWEAEADLLELQQRQLSLWGGATWESGGAASARRWDA
jgi:hypothetical protein